MCEGHLTIVSRIGFQRVERRSPLLPTDGWFSQCGTVFTDANWQAVVVPPFVVELFAAVISDSRRTCQVRSSVSLQMNSPRQQRLHKPAAPCPLWRIFTSLSVTALCCQRVCRRRPHSTQLCVSDRTLGLLR